MALTIRYDRGPTLSPATPVDFHRCMDRMLGVGALARTEGKHGESRQEREKKPRRGKGLVDEIERGCEAKRNGRRHGEREGEPR